MPKKPVLIQFDDPLLERLDSLGALTGRSRSSIVRDAVERYVTQESDAEKDRRLIAGYTAVPDDAEFVMAAEDGARRLIEEESW